MVAPILKNAVATMLQRRMTTTVDAAIHLSDEALIEAVKLATHRERKETARLIGLLTEFDARRLYLKEGCSSLFAYCTQVLHLSEHAAYGRIETARVARRFPIVLELLAEGALTLTTVTLLAPLLTPENHSEALREARYKSKRQVECLVARCVRSPPPIPRLKSFLPRRRNNEPPRRRVLTPVRPSKRGKPSCRPSGLDLHWS